MVFCQVSDRRTHRAGQTHIRKEVVRQARRTRSDPWVPCEAVRRRRYCMVVLDLTSDGAFLPAQAPLMNAHVRLP